MQFQVQVSTDMEELVEWIEENSVVEREKKKWRDMRKIISDWRIICGTVV